MDGKAYRALVARIVKNTLRKRFPGVPPQTLIDISRFVAINVHARMYGANVDGVDSPIWGDCKPNKTAKQIIEEAENEKVDA